MWYSNKVIPHSCTLQPLISLTFLIKSDKRQKGNKKILWNFTDDSSMSKELSVYYEFIREHWLLVYSEILRAGFDFQTSSLENWIRRKKNAYSSVAGAAENYVAPSVDS